MLVIKTEESTNYLNTEILKSLTIYELVKEVQVRTFDSHATYKNVQNIDQIKSQLRDFKAQPHNLPYYKTKL